LIAIINSGSKYNRKNKRKTFDTSWRNRLYEIIFEADTPAGKAFDVALLWAIVCSIIVVMLQSVSSIWPKQALILLTLEWILNVVFTVEYIARLITVPNLRRYAFSFIGLIDFLAVIST
jgi:voltage-gated potassium channel